MMEVVVATTGVNAKCAKLRSNRHHRQTNTQLFTGGMPFLSPNQQCHSTEGEIYHLPYSSFLCLRPHTAEALSDAFV